MPSIFTPIPYEIERKAPGTGGKPPVDRRPTGGGGGGGDDDWKNPRRGPREVLYRTRAFVFCALAGDMMFFVVLVALFYARQAGTRMDPRPFARSATGIPSCCRPSSSSTPRSCCSAASPWSAPAGTSFANSTCWRNGSAWVARLCAAPCPGSPLTLLLGLMFLSGQALAWKQLTAQGFAFDRWATPASYFFYIITGLARRPPGSRRTGFALLPLRAHPAQTRRVPPDRRRLDGMVLAHHGLRLAGSCSGFWCSGSSCLSSRNAVAAAMSES